MPRKADDELKQAIRDSLEQRAQWAKKPPKGPLPTAPNELGPPGSSAGLHGSAGEGGYDLAKAKAKKRARRMKIAAIRGGEATA